MYCKNYSLLLRELNENDELAFLRGYEDWKSEDLSWYSFVWSPSMSHVEHLEILSDQKDKFKIPNDRVASTMLYGFVNGEIVGRFNIRHELNEHLSKRGGHIGYSVNPSHRNKGYANQMFKQGMDYCKNLGFKKLLITCADKNIPSWKVIEKFGGSLENRIFDNDKNEFVRRYWIDLTSENFNPAKVSEKAVAYITREKNGEIQLLVFDHDKNFSDSGTQVPCGTIDAGEQPMETLIREVKEETGISNYISVDKIDQYQLFAEYAKKYIKRHVFHIQSTGLEPEKWIYKVNGHGDDAGLNFHYFWIDLKQAKGRLSARFDDSIDILIQKLKI